MPGSRLSAHELPDRHLEPVGASRRYIILDALRGFALLGICMANFPEFSLYSFLGDEARAAFATARADRAVQVLLAVFVDGKFYTLFSLLFGIGFSIIIGNAEKKGVDGFRIFYRRMTGLTLIGFLHLMFIWSGDILMLYALLGMLLPLFRNLSDRRLLAWAFALLAVPVAVDGVCELAGIRLAQPFVSMQEHYCAAYGITADNFAYWLRDADNYGDVFKFLIQGACVRLQEFTDGNRYFKVMGLFLIGFYLGRNRVYATLDDRRPWLRQIFRYGITAGLPLSLGYAWSAVNGHPLGLTAHSMLYLVSVYPMGFAYVAGLCLLYLRLSDAPLWRFLAAPGRMALTNYIGQSAIGMVLFYGIGMGLGAGTSLLQTEAIVLAVFLAEAMSSRLWLAAFRFGPLEWLWRMSTYGKWMRLRR